MTPEEIEQLIRQRIPTETADSIRRIMPLEPNTPPPQPSDSSRNPPDAQRPPRAKYDPPYIMGSTTTGSGTFTTDPFVWGDPTNTRGPWGGDSPPADETTVRTDTWHRDRPPLDASGDRTWGVECDLIRIYKAAQGTLPETYLTYIFERQAVFDAQGTPVYVTAEELISQQVVTDPKRHPFEVYVVSYTGAPKTTANCQMAWGTVRATEKVNALVTVTDLDATFTLTSGDMVWLEVVFSVASNVVSISSCARKKGVPAANGWTTYPNEMKYTSASSYTWYHLIAYVRAFKHGKNDPAADSGEIAVINTGLVIAQCTNTHLVAQQQCMIDYNDSNKIKSAARLVPGPGGVI